MLDVILCILLSQRPVTQEQLAVIEMYKMQVAALTSELEGRGKFIKGQAQVSTQMDQVWGTYIQAKCRCTLTCICEVWVHMHG